jgi:hypothetical protein
MNRGNQITKQEEQHRGLNEEEQTQTQREKYMREQVTQES